MQLDKVAAGVTLFSELQINQGKQEQQSKGGVTMKELWAGIKSFMLDEEGATATEYAVMLALIILVALAAIIFLGNAVKEGFNMVGEKIDSAVKATPATP